MIFRQYDEVLNGDKTQTRRMRKPLYTVGRTYAVVPKRGKPSHWFVENQNGQIDRVCDPRKYAARGREVALTTPQAKRILQAEGGIQVRIRLSGMYQERLQDISEQDARAEGVESVAAYAGLWDEINKHKGSRWEDNPLVWVITFQVLPEVKALYLKWREDHADD